MSKIAHKDVLSETYALLVALGDKYISRLPSDVFERISSNRNRDYAPIIDQNKTADEQGLSKDSLALLFALKRDYMCETEEEREELVQLLETNQQKIDNELNNAQGIRAKLKLF